MKRTYWILFALIFNVAAIRAITGTALGAGNGSHHCEVKKNGKSVDLDQSEAPDRKTCKKMKGKWVKAHGHSHDEGADHDHSED